ncbi:putative galactinol--sucrose galactosyltransferase 2 [Zea mays]|uniref:galactinol--sucrose galactosyltransferase n=1 Tax=Zea mays TaxID=4577 RepID=A0A1D6L8T2_MAIZE|nr:putative galactinol--sucrose galactosyltransferase 2 [Zea mays]
MTVTPRITVWDGRLVAHGRSVLAGVPDNIVLTHASGAGLVDGAFVGATAAEPSSMHVFTFGTLRDLRFVCCFRFKLWWMTQRMGTSGRDVPLETQFMLLECGPGDGHGDGDAAVYVAMLPLLEGQFRAALQGNDRDELEITLESGDKAVQTAQGTCMLYVHAGTNPFDTITQAVKVVERHMQTFHHREKKKLPSFVDWFGWCTWDAFYTDVTAESVKQGLKSLADGGTPPRFLIIDDGWQQIGSENKEESANAVVQEGAQFASRLTGIKENAKFQKKTKTKESGGGGGEQQAQTPGLKLLVEEAKREHGVRYVYVWHAMAGYWGGVKPAAEGMEHYESALAYPVQSPGVMGNQPDIVMDSLSVLGLGLVHPRRALSFYDELHSYLASCGVDGVKVDVQNIIETLGAGHGGRVALTRAYHRALEDSVARNFPDNGCISCMCHNTDMLYSARQTAVVRASDDFYPRTLTGSVRADDVDVIAGLAGDGWGGEAVVYAYRSGELVRLPQGATLPVTLKVLEFEVFHVSPVRAVAPGVSFAPIGLLDMFNSGGAVEQCEVRGGANAAAAVALRVRGCGRFGAYCSRRPARCMLDATEVEFSHDADTGLVTLHIPVPEQEFYRWSLEIEV